MTEVAGKILGRGLGYRPVAATTPDGVAIAAQGWKRAGSRRDVLFIHGFSQAHLCWLKQVTSPLAGAFRLVTYDNRGHGSSGKPVDPAFYREPRRWADEVDAVMRSLGLVRPVIVAWSYAGRIALDYLSVYSDGAISGLVMVGATSIMGPEFAGPAAPLMREMASADLGRSIEATPTTVVGSYPQPRWLIDRDILGSTVPRVRIKDVWRIPEPFLQEAQDDATILAVRDMKRAGLDVVTDGEIRRESYSNRFATALDGIDQQNPATITGRAGKPTRVPRVVGKIRRREPVEVRSVEFLRRNTHRKIKMTLPGPFTMAQQASNEFYRDDEEMVLDFAAAVNEELHELVAAGADIVQLDEPWMQAMPEVAQRYAVRAINRALEGVKGATAVHVCFGYAALVKGKTARGYSFLPQLSDTTANFISIEAAQPKLDLGILNEIADDKVVILGMLDLGTSERETPEQVADRIRRALDYLPPERIMPAPDCGMKYLERDIAFGKLCALSQGTSLVRRELSG